MVVVSGHRLHLLDQSYDPATLTCGGRLMRLVLGVTFLLAAAAPALAAHDGSVKNKLRFADATSDACFANCASQNDSCRRVCPTTFSTPCVSACDSQAQTCRRSCQSK